MFKVLLVESNTTISLDSNAPDVSAMLEYDGKVTTIPDLIAGMRGLYGHSIGEETTPLDLKAALVKNNMEFRIIEGANILDMPRQKLPDGAKW